MPRIIDLSTLQQFTAVNFSSDPGSVGGPKVIPQLAEISILWTLPDGKVAHNVLHGRYAGTFAGSVAQAEAIRAALTSGALWTAIASHMIVNASLSAVTIRDIGQPNQPVITSTGAAVPGTGTGTLLPDEVAICVTKRTALTGRANRGRLYLTGFDSLAVGGGNVITAPTVTAVTNWADAIRGIFSGQSYTMVIAQPARAAYTGSTGTLHPARAAGSVPVTALLCRDNHWDSMRKRGLK